MAYVDGFVASVPTDRREEFRAHAETFAAVFRDHGALKVVECWAEDVPHGERTDFYRAVQAKEGEAPVFSWVWWPDKATRDAGNAKVMADPRVAGGPDSMPFDSRLMIYGGFDVLLEA